MPLSMDFVYAYVFVYVFAYVNTRHRAKHRPKPYTKLDLWNNVQGFIDPLCWLLATITETDT